MAKIPSDSLKRVCLRADYTGVPFIDDWVKNDVYDAEIGQYFKDYQIAGRERLAFSTFSLEHLSELVDTPVEKLAKMKLHIFEDGKLTGYDDLMNLYLSTVSLELNIECKNYISIDPYLDLMMELVKQLKKENSKFRLRRFSIQKLNGFMSDNLDDLKYKLNTNLFYRDQKYLRPGYETEYKDSFILDEPEAHLHNT